MEQGAVSEPAGLSCSQPRMSPLVVMNPSLPEYCFSLEMRVLEWVIMYRIA